MMSSPTMNKKPKYLWSPNHESKWKRDKSIKGSLSQWVKSHGHAFFGRVARDHLTSHILLSLPFIELLLSSMQHCSLFLVSSQLSWNTVILLHTPTPMTKYYSIKCMSSGHFEGKNDCRSILTKKE
jgi:hypothetical protein